MRKVVLFLLAGLPLTLLAQYRSQVWSPDNGDGTYTNPVINADYSDPDVCVGESLPPTPSQGGGLYLKHIITHKSHEWNLSFIREICIMRIH